VAGVIQAADLVIGAWKRDRAMAKRDDIVEARRLRMRRGGPGNMMAAILMW